MEHSWFSPPNHINTNQGFLCSESDTDSDTSTETSNSSENTKGFICTDSRYTSEVRKTTDRQVLYSQQTPDWHTLIVAVNETARGLEDTSRNLAHLATRLTNMLITQQEEIAERTVSAKLYRLAVDHLLQRIEDQERIIKPYRIGVTCRNSITGWHTSPFSSFVLKLINDFQDLFFLPNDRELLLSAIKSM